MPTKTLASHNTVVQGKMKPSTNILKDSPERRLKFVEQTTNLNALFFRKA